MEPDINNMTLNEYLIYEDRNRNLARSYPSKESVAPVRNKIWVYPDSGEEDEEYYSLLLLPCFQTPLLCTTINSVHHNNHNEVVIENMTLEEYARNRNLARSYPSKESVAPVRNIIWVYPDSGEEDEEYYSLLLLLCFQTPQLCTTINSVHHNNHNEVDIENMTLEEYARCADETVDITDYEDSDHEDSELLDLPTFFATNKFASVYKQVEENISIAEEKEEAPIENVEMDEDQDIDHSHSGTKDASQWSLAKDPFLAYMEFNDQPNVMLQITLSSISKEVLTARG
ncbi:hypothetical protein Tco_0304984 [Tanacetum coccineum]